MSRVLEPEERHFGPPPRRRAKATLLELPGHDVTQLDDLGPRPELVHEKWKRRGA